MSYTLQEFLEMMDKGTLTIDGDKCCKCQVPISMVTGK